MQRTILAVIAATILLFSACLAKRERNPAAQEIAATEKPAEDATPVADEPDPVVPEFKLTDHAMGSVAGINVFDFSFNAKDAKYIEYQLCNENGECDLSPENPQQVPARMDTVSHLVRKGGKLTLRGRGCNYSGRHRKQGKVKCSDWDEIKRDVPSSENPEFLRLMGERESLAQQKSDLCPRLVTAAQGYAAQSAQNVEVKNLADFDEDQCRTVLETGLADAAKDQLRETGYDILARKAAAAEMGEAENAGEGLSLAGAGYASGGNRPRNTTSSSNSEEEQRKNLRNLGQAFEVIGIFFMVGGGSTAV